MQWVRRAALMLMALGLWAPPVWAQNGPEVVATAPSGSIMGTLQSMNPDLSLILDAAFAAFDTAQPLELGGHDPSQPGFNLQQVELHLSANVDPYFRLDSNIVYKQDEVELEEGYATSLALPANLQVRVGQFLTRFGRLNPTHPHQWHFVDEPLVNGKFFGSDGNRGVGAEVSWLTFLPWYAEIIVSANNVADACCARSYALNTPLGSYRDALWTGAIKQFFSLSDDLSLLWGLSAQTGPGDGGRTAIYGTDIYLHYSPLDSPNRQGLSLQIETMLRRRDVPAAPTLSDFGGYAEVLWNITPRWEIGGRGEYVSGLADDPLDPEWTQARTRYAAQVTFYPTHFSRLRLQGAIDRPGWLDTPIYAGFLALEVVTGAHGAHAY